LAVAASVLPSGQRVIDKVMAASPGVQLLLAVGGFTLVLILLSAGIHLLIRGFEMGRPTSPRV